jgi:UDP-glucose 4-epimerase
MFKTSPQRTFDNFENRILITGGAGFVGSHLADSIVKRNAKDLVVVADNFFLGHENNLNIFMECDNGVVERVDISSQSALFHIIRKYSINTIWNLAVVPLPTSLSYPEWTITNNINCAIAICEASRFFKNLRIVNFSSSETYGTALKVPMDESHPIRPETPYAASKASTDLIFDSYSRTFNIPILTLKPFNMYGPRQNKGSYAGIIPIIINKLIKNETIEIFGDGTQTRDFVYVKDSVFAALVVEEMWIGNTSETFNIGTQVETSINNLIKIISNEYGKIDPKIVYVPRRQGDVQRHCACVTKFKSFTNHDIPSFTAKSINETIDWYKLNA